MKHTIAIGELCLQPDGTYSGYLADTTGRPMNVTAALRETSAGKFLDVRRKVKERRKPRSASGADSEWRFGL